MSSPQTGHCRAVTRADALLKVRGYRVAGPFTRYALQFSLSGCITGTGALLQNSPQLLLLGAVLPHKLRVRSCGAFV